MRGEPQKVAGRNKVREFIKQFFAERDCATLIRPVSQEQQLQTLAQLHDDDLRPEYKAQVQELKDMIFNKATPKKMHGHSLSGAMLMELTRTYVEAMNTGAVLTISTAWENVVTQENHKAVSHASKCYESKMREQVDEAGILAQDDLEYHHKSCRLAAIKIFRAKAVGGNYWKLEDELNKFMEDIYDKLRLQNQQRSHSECEKMMNDMSHHIDDQIPSKIQTIEHLESEWNRNMNEYEHNARGPSVDSSSRKVLVKKQVDTARRVHNHIIKAEQSAHEEKLKAERSRHDEEYQRIYHLHEDNVLVRKNLDGLVSQLTQENADLNKRILKTEDEMRTILGQSLKMRKKMERMEKEHLDFMQQKQELEINLKKKGINIEEFFAVDKCSIM
eukprot:TRINITY_DN9973_c0_g1_i1.p1 TRINITY_DN9973_c0_g1~~TRINITY_DN9973_c0_g1_i1.p1  ORF type:complete len:388 (-),score=105.80 TRINITY_DN9973_c0_g1_i1:34-1197(-)